MKLGKRDCVAFGTGVVKIDDEANNGNGGLWFK